MEETIQALTPAQAPEQASNAVEEVKQSPVEQSEVVTPEVPTEPKTEEQAVEEGKKNHRDRRIEQAFRDRDRFRGQVELLQQQLQSVQQGGTTPQQDVEPDASKFQNTDEGYRQYMVQHQQWLAREQKRQIESLKGQINQPAPQPRQDVAEFAKQNPDYYEVVQAASGIPIPPPVIEAISRDPDLLAIQYHLAKNVEEAYALNDMSPAEALMELGRIKSDIRRSKDKPRQVKTTQAPPAFKAPVGGADKGPKDLAKMSPEEYARQWREKRGLIKKR